MFCSLVRKGASKGLTLIRPAVTIQQNATIMGKSLRGSSIARPPPFPYKDKAYNYLSTFFDTTLWRFDENSKIIVVDGPIAAGKTAFAKALAEELELYHLEEATMDDIYINSYGYDLRQLDPKIPASCSSFDARNFCQHPRDSKATRFQFQMYQVRYAQYIDAMAHILNTGQGVVLERSPYSDQVFMEAMYHEGYVNKNARKWYYAVRENTLPEIFQPHLIIYLDVPVPIVQQRIKQRGLSHEVNSPALSNSYLHAMENFYKQHYLKEASVHAELMVYDWSQGGEVEAVVEDIERIDFDKFEEDKLNPKMRDWRFKQEFELTAKRVTVSSAKADLMYNMDIELFEVPELMIEANEFKKFRETWESAPGMEYAEGYNADQGDKGILFKTKSTVRPRNVY